MRDRFLFGVRQAGLSGGRSGAVPPRHTARSRLAGKQRLLPAAALACLLLLGVAQGGGNAFFAMDTGLRAVCLGGTAPLRPPDKPACRTPNKNLSRIFPPSQTSPQHPGTAHGARCGRVSSALARSLPTTRSAATSHASRSPSFAEMCPS